MISICGFSHRGPDDPIVLPRQPGFSHDHTFVGNDSTNAFSTPAQLRIAGTTCRRTGDKAAYWMPTLFVGGQAMTPATAIAYYRRLVRTPLRPFPAGLQIVAGNSHATSHLGTELSAERTGLGDRAVRAHHDRRGRTHRPRAQRISRKGT